MKIIAVTKLLTQITVRDQLAQNTNHKIIERIMINYNIYSMFPMTNMKHC